VTGELTSPLRVHRPVRRPRSRVVCVHSPFTILIVLSGFLAVASAAVARERNFWPLFVQQIDESSGQVESWTAAGPFLFSRPGAEGEKVSGLRPFWVQTKDADGDRVAALALYPLFFSSADDESYRWSVYQLIRRSGPKVADGQVQEVAEEDASFEIWPFWFSRQTGDPETSYRALFPLAGTLKGRFGFDQISWMPFPLYLQMTKRGATTTMAPWPFVRVARGEARGVALWPLYGRLERPGPLREEFFLWPFGYNHIREVPEDAPPGTPPGREIGALPFYAHSSGPGFRSESYLWPFFGYTDQTTPVHYHETRYFWPFLVQGRGENKHVNRWGPFYTRSVVKGTEKTWHLWPVHRRLQRTDDGLIQTKHQVGLFLYWSLEQRSATNPDLAPAYVRHLWPLASAWDDGAGRRQFQFPSPLEVFFPGNAKIRATWGPFFSVYRQERQRGGRFRASVLWNAITWERDPEEDRKAFHLGPLLGMERTAEQMRFAVLGGLLGANRDDAGRRWRVLWMNLPAGRDRAAPDAPKESNARHRLSRARGPAHRLF
jgi:hypothetical protein